MPICIAFCEEFCNHLWEISRLNFLSFFLESYWLWYRRADNVRGSSWLSISSWLDWELKNFERSNRSRWISNFMGNCKKGYFDLKRFFKNLRAFFASFFKDPTIWNFSFLYSSSGFNFLRPPPWLFSISFASHRFLIYLPGLDWMLVLTVQIEHYPVWIVFEYKLIMTRVQNNFSFDEKTLNRTVDSSFSIY